jgi:hypothetical protein
VPKRLLLVLLAVLCFGTFQALATAGSPAPAPMAEPASTTVYVTKTGAKYHRGTCQYLRKSKIAITLSEAKKSYTACSVCNPPT